MIKVIKLTALATFMFVATVNTANAAFPKDKVEATTTVTTVSTITNEATTEVSTLTKAEAKKQAKEFKKANNWYAGGSKSKIVAALLAFFLGGLGIHSFYMGNKKKGLIQLGLSVLGFVLFFAGAAKAVTTTTATASVGIAGTALIGLLLILGVSIWAFVDFIRILTGGLAPEEGFND